MTRSLFIAVACGTLAVLLPGCSTIMDKPTQDLKIDIAGTGEALCDLTQSGRRYRAYAPSTVSIQKSREPLHVRCFAPGNREINVVLESETSATTMANASNGILPGVAWDAISGAMYKYPDKVLVDFTGMPPKPYPLPDYQQVLDKNPALAGMEEFQPGRAALIRDMGASAPAMQRRPEEADYSDETLDAPPAVPAAVPTGRNADDLTRAANPQVFSTAPDEDK